MADAKTQLNIKIDAKIHWLANLAARDLNLTLAEFVEGLITQGISEKAMREALNAQQPTPGTEPRIPTAPAPLWHEALWSPDEATRLFHMATYSNDLMTDAQRRIWSVISGQIVKSEKRFDLKTFRQHFEFLQRSNSKSDK